MGNPVVKAVPEDFVVREVMALPQRPSADPGHTYLNLRKKGFTTFEAMDLIARHLALPADAVSAAGLKDEDGVTEQTLSVAAEVPSALLDAFNRRWTPGTGRWLALDRAGSGPRRLGIGELLGNAFLLTLRGLEADEADRLRSVPRGEAPVLFANYYDTQRFGVAGGPKVTHLIGQALLDDDLDLAFALLRTSGSHEGGLALQHTGPADEFFAGLDQRVTAFYRTAHSSYLWNHRLGRLLEQHGPDVLQTEREGLGYTYPTTTRPLLGLLGELPELEYDKWRWTNSTLRRTTSRRPTTLQTIITIRDVAPDDMFPDLWKCTVSFILPSGAYATNAVSQFLLQLTCAQRPALGVN
ncbi:tRNA pseudouridine(13) synthase TruD [Streptomyces roseirectus]|uniref:tRNA pseudouridine(13) synthase TruD n=1 Tax=Streptomyces roseirectus TaxID=2768066 RepID=A0A7H0IE63_9ACTN|nr:tRNA pseudouridine(13) synthase TruD [Streptomyces roseirectus]QNP71079.1 tRNA pseudouridine(13) synthase TruD [Streptomyces roseirectus]